MELHKAQIEAMGWQSIAIGLGEPKHAKHYCGKLAPSLTCLVSEGIDAYSQYGMRDGTLSEGLANTFNIAAASMKAFLNGHIQGRATGDTQMMGGTFVVDPTGIIRYAHYNVYAGDDPDIETVISFFNKKV